MPTLPAKRFLSDDKSSATAKMVLDGRKPGSFVYTYTDIARGSGPPVRTATGMSLICPKCQTWLGLIFERHKWNGNKNFPTFEVSIHCPVGAPPKFTGCGWHGYMVAGELIDAEDFVPA